MAAAQRLFGSTDRCAIIPATAPSGLWQMRSRSFENLRRRESEFTMHAVCSRLIAVFFGAMAFCATAAEHPDFFSKPPSRVQILVGDDGLRSLRANSHKNVS